MLHGSQNLQFICSLINDYDRILMLKVLLLTWALALFYEHSKIALHPSITHEAIHSRHV